MNFTCSELENIEISIEYFLLIKQVGEEFIKYLKGYKQISQEYMKKLNTFENNFGKKMSKIFENPKISHTAEMMQKVMDIIIQNIQSFNASIREIDVKLQELESIIKEKTDKIICLKKTYLDLPKNLMNSYNEINKTKATYIIAISKTEEIVDKYFIDKDKIQKHESGIGEKLDETEYKNIKSLQKLKLNDMNISLKLSKKYEDFHKGSISACMKVQDKFLDNCNNYISEIKNSICDISSRLKDLVSSFMLLYKNIYKQPLNIIDECIKKFNSFEEIKEMDKIINSYFKNDNNLKYITPIKYQLKAFTNLKESNYFKNSKDYKEYKNIEEVTKDINLNKIKRKVVEYLEDGFQVMSYISDQSLLMTIKCLFENFDLIDKGDFDLKFEEGKNKTQNYILKIIENMNSYPYAKDGFYTNNKLENKNYFISNYKREELTYGETNDLKELLDIHENRIIFLQKMSDYRALGKFVLYEKDFFLLTDLYNIICSKIKRDSDYRVAELVIVISETYYMEEGNRKKYIQEAIKQNELFKDKNFWEEFLCYSINKEIMKTLTRDEKIKEDKAVSDYKFSNVVFTQILTLIDNMFEFDLDFVTIKEVLDPKINVYKLNDDFKVTINDIIETKKKQKEEENKK